MAYSRLVNVEYRSEQDMEQFLKNWKDWMPKHMPDAISRTMVKTGPASSLLMAVYTSCLLYTSPSPRDMRRSRMPSSA